MRVLPAWLTMLGSLLFLFVVLAFIFLVARGCIATQESTQIRKYVTGADSLLSDSSDLGNGQLQPALKRAGGEPGRVSREALSRVADRSEDLYRRALENDEVPPEFDDAHHYLVSALGIRAQATARLASAAGGDGGRFQQALAEAVESFRISDGIVRNHYIPAVGDALQEAGHGRDRVYLEEPEPFMDYEEVGFEAGGASVPAQDDPNALHGVEIVSVTVAGQPLYPGGNVVLTGSDEPVFSVTVANGGEVPETAVPVEVILNTRAERQARTVTIERIEPGGGQATVEVSGFRPGQLNETAEVTVKAGPVEYEDYTQNNTLTGTVTFGM
ncbi:hypothetical protein Rxyl_0028 [Rubrobacter xylanophilus DSM 9941]|uniref:CARDB domain-containing protein n=1 Tax=Rubrobacter xylanophilus (strain DSM 9941 / JCM 11954 / NBRC 16129 / PRD-1) TaxID=266117 RepID=Q1B019_RUBXD|nr:hypothetical protein [Rubrobacter xylanophilus]ABG03009.1 hypothetical protein Rxyl_0028 [Rubrobacter xylanophilus DSM 9941]